MGRAITQRLVEALGLPEEEVTVENLEGYNQKALSVKIDERNAHITSPGWTGRETTGRRQGPRPSHFNTPGHG